MQMQVHILASVAANSIKNIASSNRESRTTHTLFSRAKSEKVLGLTKPPWNDQAVGINLVDIHVGMVLVLKWNMGGW